jgi:hypothetical protein
MTKIKCLTTLVTGWPSSDTVAFGIDRQEGGHRVGPGGAAAERRKMVFRQKDGQEPTSTETENSLVSGAS